MVKTLTVGIKDKDNDQDLNIIGTRSSDGFNEIVIVAIGQTKIAVNSKLLAEALKEVVDFQTVPKSSIILQPGGIILGKQV